MLLFIKWYQKETSGRAADCETETLLVFAKSSVFSRWLKTKNLLTCYRLSFDVTGCQTSVFQKSFLPVCGGHKGRDRTEVQK